MLVYNEKKIVTIQSFVLYTNMAVALFVTWISAADFSENQQLTIKTIAVNVCIDTHYILI